MHLQVDPPFLEKQRIHPDLLLSHPLGHVLIHYSFVPFSMNELLFGEDSLRQD